ncbi:ATP-dependent helicase HrpB [Roseiconus lacunae]|uniref:ATP-dependent helicase HrpB n=1 Tax=Roseiconus lacunae TaxID=2605694 RepID=UPI001E55843C|nr:ATP-dependent helicase HrpB [Roseiconus lacunae]MCD0462527.1 ATP-dependent helicase HrpB [Roseiconus lacunae]
MDSESLPIDDCLDDLISAVKANRSVILRAPPGAGKTTGVPPALLRSGVIEAGRILMLQPRRVAARAAAMRLSGLAGETVGQTYGYHVRFDRRRTDTTAFVSMTSGILLRQLTSDPLLDDVGCVILDEFHERSIEIDLVLGMLHRIRSTLRPELRLVVMSATLETAPIEHLIDDAVVIESEGRAYPVDVRYDRSLQPMRPTAKAIAERVARLLPNVIENNDGDILVFLPGVGEINQTARQIDSIARKAGIEVNSLFGDLSAEKQDAILRPSPVRKIVLATNVAETSLTIPNVRCVIDSGLARVAEFDSSVGLTKLQLQSISKASADQRAGRAGRTAPGVCYRLWSKPLDRGRPDHTPPEILRTDLASAMLCLASWGERETFQFPWVTPPTESSVTLANQQLQLFEAIDSEQRLTETGQQMISLPVHPRLARLMLAAAQFDCVEPISIAAAMLSERDPFPRGLRTTRESTVESDLIDRLLRLRRYLEGTSDSDIHHAAARTIERVAKQLVGIIPKNASREKTKGRTAGSLEEAISRSLLAAYPDRLAKRRRPGASSGVMVGGRGVKLDSNSSVRTAEFFLCIDVDGKGSEATVRRASAIDPAWIPHDWISERVETFFHPSMKAIVARSRRYVLDLCTGETPCSSEPNDQSAELLYQHANQQIASVLPNDKATQRFLDRWRFLDSYDDSGALPMPSSEAIDTVLKQFCQSMLSFKELSEAPWLDYLRGLFDYDQLQWFETQAPEKIQVPSGNQFHLTYELGKRPVLAVRLQELFGWPATPTIAGGKTTIQLHLLGPNYRPQQITDDLESFWKTTYLEVKKELKRRYPKHHWPDDPANAQATRNGLKPKST